MSDLGISAAKAYMQTASTLANDKAAPSGGLGGGFGDMLNSAITSVQHRRGRGRAGDHQCDAGQGRHG